MRGRTRGAPRFADEPILPACGPTAAIFAGFTLTVLAFSLYALGKPYELVMVVALAALVAGILGSRGR